MRCPSCLREDLPTAAAMPHGVMPCSHVTPPTLSEPCRFGPAGVYDHEVKALIASDDALWDAGFPSGPDATPPGIPLATTTAPTTTTPTPRAPRRRSTSK